MLRDTGLWRTTLLTGALVAASVAGAVAAGMAAHAAETSTGTTSESPAPAESWPSLSGGDTGSDSGQATSGGS